MRKSNSAWTAKQYVETANNLYQQYADADKLCDDLYETLKTKIPAMINSSENLYHIFISLNQMQRSDVFTAIQHKIANLVWEPQHIPFIFDNLEHSQQLIFLNIMSERFSDIVKNPADFSEVMYCYKMTERVKKAKQHLLFNQDLLMKIIATSDRFILFMNKLNHILFESNDHIWIRQQILESLFQNDSITAFIDEYKKLKKTSIKPGIFQTSKINENSSYKDIIEHAASDPTSRTMLALANVIFNSKSFYYRLTREVLHANGTTLRS